jgi:hypothetical protein
MSEQEQEMLEPDEESEHPLEGDESEYEDADDEDAQMDRAPQPGLTPSPDER